MTKRPGHEEAPIVFNKCPELSIVLAVDGRRCQGVIGALADDLDINAFPS
jgi:hypothetical protein